MYGDIIDHGGTWWAFSYDKYKKKKTPRKKLSFFDKERKDFIHDASSQTNPPFIVWSTPFLPSFTEVG